MQKRSMLYSSFVPPATISRLSIRPVRLLHLQRARKFNTLIPPYASIRPKQSLSQNFLKDRKVIQRIISSFDEIHKKSAESQVVEVGPGLGALTDDLLKLYPGLHTIELDQRAVEFLRTSYPNLSVMHGDVLKVNWDEMTSDFGMPLSIIGNLPYNIVSQILFSLFEAPPGTIDFALVMMQKEVAERIVSRIRKKSYGILSIVGQLYSEPEILFDVPGTAFYPKPDVTSCIVMFKMKTHPDFDPTDIAVAASLRRIVRAAFSQRRKVLRNSLAGVCPTLPDSWQSKRAEELSPSDFLMLAKQYKRDECQTLKTVWR